MIWCRMLGFPPCFLTFFPPYLFCWCFSYITGFGRQCCIFPFFWSLKLFSSYPLSAREMQPVSKDWRFLLNSRKGWDDKVHVSQSEHWLIDWLKTEMMPICDWPTVKSSLKAALQNINITKGSQFGWRCIVARWKLAYSINFIFVFLFSFLPSISCFSTLPLQADPTFSPSPFGFISFKQKTSCSRLS